MSYSDLAVFKEGALVFWSDCSHLRKSDDIGLSHHNSANMRIEFKIVVKNLSYSFNISVSPGFVVCIDDGHKTPNDTGHIR